MISLPSSNTANDQTAARICFGKSLLILLLGLAPVPVGWAGVRAAMDSMRSSELNRADREASAGGYYEGLIGGGEGPQGARGELAMALLGKPTDWGRFHAANVTQRLPDGDFLEFFLKPNLNLRLFGHPFTTNRHGMRDRDYPLEKPEGVYRIAVLGSSIDMGWGIGVEETYVRRLEDWLNAHAKKLKVDRKFEVLNFGVAAFSPLQRVEYYRRKARTFQPDLVIFSATMLDQRLMEIHLGDVFAEKGDLTYDFLSEILKLAKVTREDLRVEGGRLPHKETVRKKLHPYYWMIYDHTLATLAAEELDAQAETMKELVAQLRQLVGETEASREGVSTGRSHLNSLPPEKGSPLHGSTGSRGVSRGKGIPMPGDSIPAPGSHGAEDSSFRNF